MTNSSTCLCESSFWTAFFEFLFLNRTYQSKFIFLFLNKVYTGVAWLSTVRGALPFLHFFVLFTDIFLTKREILSFGVILFNEKNLNGGTRQVIMALIYWDTPVLQ